MHKVHSWFSNEELYAIACNSLINDLSIHTIDEAYDFCLKIAAKHYENFPVASIIVPKSIRKHIIAIYVFSRIADDIADELSLIWGTSKALDILDIMHHNLQLCSMHGFEGNNPLWLALQDTFEKKGVQKEAFERLLKAFAVDIEFKKADTFDDLMLYCEYSANPIGELLLALFECDTPEMIEYSNKLCSGLQILNFVQDISVDKEKGRLFIPSSYYPSTITDVNHLFDQENSVIFSQCLDKMIAETENLLNSSTPIVYKVPSFRLHIEMSMILEGGKAMLKKCKKEGLDLLTTKPTLSLLDWGTVLSKVLIKSPLYFIRY